MGYEVPLRRVHKLIIAFPSSVTAVDPTLREKTLTVGRIGRYISIFRVDEVIVYVDDPKYEKEAKIITDILEYMEIPPYLKKKLVPLKETLKFAGLLPPLQAPHHQVDNEVKIGEIRNGIITKIRRKVLIDIGVNKLFELEQSPKYKLKKNKRITVEVTSIEPPKVKIIDRKDLKVYWGFQLFTTRSLREAIRKANADLIIATSRYGTSITNVLNSLKKDLEKSRRILILFGGPYKGLYEIAKDEKWNLEEKVNYVINTIPYQGVKTIRTEEAIVITLALVNTLIPI